MICPHLPQRPFNMFCSLCVLRGDHTPYQKLHYQNAKPADHQSHIVVSFTDHNFKFAKYNLKNSNQKKT